MCNNRKKVTKVEYMVQTSHIDQVTSRCRTSIRAPPGVKLGPRQSLKFRDNLRS